MNKPTSFEQLLVEAPTGAFRDPLLFVFADAKAPAPMDALHNCAGGHCGRTCLIPLMSLELLAEEVPSFDSLVRDSCELMPAWNVVFVCRATRADGSPPCPSDITAGIRSLVKRVRSGCVDDLFAFNRTGALLPPGSFSH